MFPGSFDHDSFDHIGNEFVNVHKFANTAIIIIMPLLHLLYMFNRFIIIHCPSLIPRYCSKKQTCFLIFCFIVISIIFSLHELFDENLRSLNVVFLLVDKAQAHEQYWDAITMFILVGEILVFFACSLVFLKKTNDTLWKTICFLLHLDAEKHGKRAASYKKIIHYNTCHFIVSTGAMTLNLCKAIPPELLKRDNFTQTRTDNQEPLTLQFAYALLTAEVLLSLEISLFPLLMAIYLPTTKKQFLHVVKTLRGSKNRERQRNV